MMGSALPLDVWTDDIATDIGREKYLRDRHNIILMQFTGLHDNNGKEIYEGDILKDGKGQPGHVLWAHNSWLMEWMVRDYEGKLTYEKMLDDCFGYGEVIGNIYENPELLQVGEEATTE
jgi:hypothetical protein